MSSVSAPLGMQAVYSGSGGSARYEAFSNNNIASGYGSSIYVGSPVTLTTNGTITVSAAATDIYGVFAGCRYLPTGGTLYQTGMWPAGQAYVAGTLEIYVYVDPSIVYAIQANGPLAQTSIGDQADFANVATGNSSTGVSNAQISTTLAGAGVQAQLRIIDLYQGYQQDNAWGDAFTTVLVQIARQQYVANKTAI